MDTVFDQKAVVEAFIALSLTAYTDAVSAELEKCGGSLQWDQVTVG